MKPLLNLGAWRHLNGAEGGPTLRLPAEHLVTHGVVVGMTGSGKTGLCTVMIEEAARARVPTVVIDVKGEAPRALLMFDEVYGFLPPHPANPPTKRPLVSRMSRPARLVQRLAPRWFVVRNAHATSPPILMQPRFAMALLRGPMTRKEIRAARGVKEEPACTPESPSGQRTPAESEPWTERGPQREVRAT
jgi:hypothetical protein